MYDAKRLLGERFHSARERAKLWPFEIVDEGGLPAYRVICDGKQRVFAPEQISAMGAPSFLSRAPRY